MKHTKFTSRFFLFFLIVVGVTLILSPVSAACASGYHACGGKCVGCPSGSVLGSDCKCHQQCGSSNTYCTSGRCCNGHCVSCPSGSILGTDCKCHAACGSSGRYCGSDSNCCNGNCLSCPSGTILGSDCKCYKSCGSSGNYCISGTCCDGKCISCSSGYLGTDCKCHSQISNNEKNSVTNTSVVDSDYEDEAHIVKGGFSLAKIIKFLASLF